MLSVVSNFRSGISGSTETAKSLAWLWVAALLGFLALTPRGTAQTTEIPQNPSPAASPKAGTARTLELDQGVVLDLVWIPAGNFLMGSPFEEDGRFITEGRRHPVTLTQGFWMGKHPVTQDQWQRLMGDNPSHVKAGRLPVDQVNWDDCQKFVRALNRMVETDHLTASLPTEAQWEYACRGGSQTRFWSGESAADLARVAWLALNSGDKPHEVGQKPPNPWGLCDMHGNVWQWCQDWHGSYPRDAVTDPRGPDTGSERVLRGGSWSSDPDVCRAAYRFSYPPAYRLMTAGLRVIVTTALSASSVSP